MSDDQHATGRDILECLDALQQSTSIMLAIVSRQMTPSEIDETRAALEAAEMKIIKLKLRFPVKR